MTILISKINADLNIKSNCNVKIQYQFQKSMAILISKINADLNIKSNSNENSNVKIISIN